MGEEESRGQKKETAFFNRSVRKWGGKYSVNGYEPLGHYPHE